MLARKSRCLWCYATFTMVASSSVSLATHMQKSLLHQYILSALQKVHLDIDDCISQCYDGASVMSGCNSGVSARILEINPKALYIHCHAHRLNLVLVDQLAEASDFFSLLECLYVFISSSVPHSVFISKQSSSRKVELKRLSDTRWSCRHSSIKAIKTSLCLVHWKNCQKEVIAIEQ